MNNVLAIGHSPQCGKTRSYISLTEKIFREITYIVTCLVHIN